MVAQAMTEGKHDLAISRVIVFVPNKNTFTIHCLVVLVTPVVSYLILYL